ncbi:MAG: VOC family protein [Defluviicoccus sp.]|nr:VOC family protein [Defluviicoccus sp.]
MATTLRERYVPKSVNPMRMDPPGTVTSMPSPNRMHHLHIFSDENYDAMVTFYQRLFNAEIVAVNEEQGPPLTFLTYDDHDHRVVIIKKPGWGARPENKVGVSHLAFCYASLGELIYVYKRMKGWGYPAPHWTVNHGNSTSFYYKDPDGNEVETMLDNYSTLDTQTYKRYYQFTEEFGPMREGNFDPDKMVELYESGMPESILLDREEVRRMVRDGIL